MFILVTTLIFVLAAVFCFILSGNHIKRSEKNGDGNLQVVKTVRWLGPVLCVLVAALITFISAIRIIDSTEALVIRTFGRVDGIKTAGFQMINPFTQTGEKYSLNTNQMDLDFQVYSKDSQTVDVQMTVQYALRLDLLTEIARQYGSEEMLTVQLRPAFEDRTKLAFSNQSAMVILETRESLSPKVRDLLRFIEDTYLVNIGNVTVSINFSDEFDKAAENKMLAEQAMLQAQYDKEKAEIEAQQAKAVAEIRAEANLEVAKKNADALRESARGEADAQETLQRVWADMSPDVREIMLRQAFLEAWNGELWKVMTGSDSSVLLDPSVFIAPDAES